MQVPRNDHVVTSQRLALQVERYHTWPKVHRQSDGEHTAQVMRIYVALWGSPRPEVWLAILEHDMPEMRFGDLPFSGDFAPELKAAKAAVEERVQESMHLTAHTSVTPLEARRIKLADVMDCYEWGVHEQRLGNAYGATVAHNVEQLLLQLAHDIDDQQLVLRHMRKVSERP